MRDKKLSFGWTILAMLALWPLFGFVAYVLGTLARAALVG